MRIYKEEIFGPVLSVVRTPISRLPPSSSTTTSTATDRDLTRDGDAAREFSNRIQIGMVGINVPIPVPMAFHSFWRLEALLFGDMAVHGPEGVRFYTRSRR